MTSNRADNRAYKRPQYLQRPQRLWTCPWTYAALALLLGLGACSTSGGRPTVQGLEVSAPGQNELIFSGVQRTVSEAQTLTLRNTGDAPLTIYSLALGGPGAGAFRLAAPALPLTLGPGGSADLAVSFAPGAPGTFNASLEVASSDPANASTAVALYGLGSAGEGGELEPTLAQVAQTLGYGVDVGGSGLLGVGAEAVGSEVAVTLFERAGDGPVTLTVVARYGPEERLPYGFFTLEGAKPVRREVGRVAAGDAQELLPPRAAGTESFDPGGNAFGLFAEAGGGRQYSLGGLNRGDVEHALRVFPLADRAGNMVADSYLVALEEAANGDYQDAVFVLQNARPSSAAVPDAAALGGWESLFNGTDLTGWYSYLPSQGVGRDPEGVFRAENGTLHVLGVANRGEREFGYLATERSYRDYHLRLEFRWGTARFAPRADKKRDSGVIYHVTGRDQVWPQGVEYQIQEGDTGDFWLLGGTTLTTTVESVQPDEPRYEQNGLPYTSRRGDFVRIIKNGTFESDTDWNTVDIIVRGDTAVHKINGQANNRAYSLHAPNGAALTGGKIMLQAEGAEIFYRNIQIRPLGGP